MRSTRTWLRSLLLMVATFVASSTAHAQSQILVSEILPSLAQTELGAVPIAAEPLPGASSRSGAAT